MVSKITMFELHFDGGQFGPASIQTGSEVDEPEATGSETDEPETTGSEADEPEARSKSPVITFLQGAAVFVVLFVVLWVVFSRLFADDDQ